MTDYRHHTDVAYSTGEERAAAYAEAYAAAQPDPGPTLEATVGDILEIRLTNRLPEPTVVYWYGLRIPAAMDGMETVQRP